MSNMPLTPGLMISAPSSGTGKTMLMLGLLAALRAREIRVQPFKSGPDYIDPAFHLAAAGQPSFNLDSWAMGQAQIVAHLQGREPADLVLAEGSMGLFDGVASPGEHGIGASAEIAMMTGWPVLLVLDVSGQAQSAAAIAHGFATLAPDLPFAGVVLNRVASPRHEALIREGMARAGIAVLGSLPRRGNIELPERHLGLVQAEETPHLRALLDQAGEFVGQHCDLDAILAAAAARPLMQVASHHPVPPPGQRIALARDEAFSFVYPHLIDEWRRQGATILPFSPLADQAPDDSADCCWLPGGYPELHAGRIAGAGNFCEGLARFARSRPVHGECGGYMVLGAGLTDAEGKRHAMTGLLGLETSYHKRRMHLGYRMARLDAPMPGLQAGATLRGHEFHYASILSQPDEPLARVSDANGNLVAETGSHRVMPGGGHVTGTFFHLISRSQNA
ncbi:cobyrinate a,c-diamide synthase [Paracoccus seriniphilus]|uniref:Hydrogenobyrinate a,c-diamide synthase n=1 Tax=Paracoccus seriniphilus TaxID=184748 RepID=A0A239PL68_9RHOB|nr:cobyrinate a,c-diamide synthase [Paracoccus seriniphilus]WCR13830.1 cobyrinate a,c-diamide synthase [Paracoccus seriniphilus]SNT68551.1 hydrogenobyrinic acid a,c-diamide synthase (glutamine-hydrolysing) /cobyrinate a,c-diamide synthase [Paracoccus seriniphilus]